MVGSDLQLCHPFQQIDVGNFTFTWIAADAANGGKSFVLSFFASKLGVDSTDDWGTANMGAYYEEVLNLVMSAHVPKTKKIVTCKTTIPGWDNVLRYSGRIYCDLDQLEIPPNDVPKQLDLYVNSDKVPVQLCNSGGGKLAKSADGGLNTAICVRSFQAKAFGTNQIMVKPHHVTEWIEYHALLGIKKFYLFERVRDDLKNYLKSYLKKNPHRKKVVDLMYIPYLHNSTKTFDMNGAVSYVYDQIITMQYCFSKARMEGYDLVLHTDFDEFVHTKNRSIPIATSLKNDIAKCPNDHSLTLERANIIRAGSDPPNTPANAVWGRKQDNTKSAFNATAMGKMERCHNPHAPIMEDKCFSESLYLHHLPDLYFVRSNNANFSEFLNLTVANAVKDQEESMAMMHPANASKLHALGVAVLIVFILVSRVSRRNKKRLAHDD